MKRTAELVIIVLGCALVYSRVARDHRPPSSTASPVAVPSAALPALTLYECPHEFADQRSEDLLERAYEDTKNPKSLALFEKLLKREPKSPIGYYHKGDALSDQARYPEAIAALDQAIALQPGFANALYTRAYCHNELEDPKGWEAGLADITQALALDEDAENHDLRATLLLKLKRPAEALAESDRALKLDETREIREQRADILEALHKTKEAAQDRKRAKELPAE